MNTAHSTTRGGWVNASRQHPCPVCDKHDWCRRTEDGGIIDCYRQQGVGGFIKQDKIGRVYWRHYGEVARG